MTRVGGIMLVLLGLPELLRAQFVPALLQNRSYWGDGKSEIDLYQADFIRDGEPHQGELVVTLTPEWVDPASFEHRDRNAQPQPLPAIEMNQSVTIARGLATEQQSIRAVWRMDLAALARVSFAGTDGIGQIVKRVCERRAGNELAWQYACDTYLGRADLQEFPSTKKLEVFYEELPLRVRTVDFSKPDGQFEIFLMPGFVHAEPKLGEFKPAKLSWKTSERSIAITLDHAGGQDRFVLDSRFPFLLREWIAADGTRWKMKNSIRADYRKYLRNGDRERALKDPMLRHPD
jgi:hypothetical protein